MAVNKNGDGTVLVNRWIIGRVWFCFLYHSFTSKVCRRRKKLVFILTESFRQAEHLHNTFYLVVKIFRNWKFQFFNVLPCNNQKCLFMVALLYYEVNFHWRNSDLYYVLGELISRSILNQSSIKDYDFDVTGFELWYNWRSKARTW